MLSDRWIEVINKVDHAFQPIVNMNTGVTFGVEALLRNWENVGFSSIADLFNQAFEEKVLFELDLSLREKALNKFLTIPCSNKLKLFYNLDNRLILMPDYSIEKNTELLKSHNLPVGSLCFEVSEQHPWVDDMTSLLHKYKSEQYRVALDDFGAGFAGLQLLYSTEPNFVKMDRFFIDNICCDAKKKLFVSHSVSLAHTLSIQVVAEGVETKSEFFACSDIGCDLVQGYLVAHPTTNIDEILPLYNHIRELKESNKRLDSSDVQLIRDQICWIQPLNYQKNTLSELFDFFRTYSDEQYFPIISNEDEPIGIVHEKELKPYVYSPYGRDLLQNSGQRKNIMEFLTMVPTAEITTPIEKILELYSLNQFTSECILITENGKYSGVLTTKMLLTTLNQKSIAIARDLNPLSRLPGNSLINEFIGNEIFNELKERTFTYFDIDNFKPFNDIYGFRTGDRVIQIFTDILNTIKKEKNYFIGHIGGDDFFVGTSEDTTSSVVKIINEAQVIFAETVKNLYKSVHKDQGYIRSNDRFGVEREFKLMEISAATLSLPKGVSLHSDDELNSILASLKKDAKSDPDKFSLLSL